MNSLAYILSVAGVSLLLFGAPALAEESSVIEPNTPEVAKRSRNFAGPEPQTSETHAAGAPKIAA